MHKHIIAFFLCVVVSNLYSQEATVWKRTEQTESFSGAKYSEFELVGQFLTLPRALAIPLPSLILHCQEGKHGVGYHVFRSGNRLSTYLRVGAVLNRTPDGVPVLYRLDDGKPQAELWSVSTDGTAVFFGEPTFDNIIYGHVVPHKEHSSPPVRKVVIAVDEAFATRIVMQFDMPDPSVISETCGMIIHKNQ